MKSMLALLFVVASAYGIPSSSSSQQQQLEVSKTARALQSVSHMAVVEAFSPISAALYQLESQWAKLQDVASQNSIIIPQITIPNMDLSSVYTCQSQSEPKYISALNYILSKQNDIQQHVQNAQKIAHGLQAVQQLIRDNKVDQATLQAMSSKLTAFLQAYSSIVSGVQSSICSQSYHSISDSSMTSPLDIFISEKEHRDVLAEDAWAKLNLLPDGELIPDHSSDPT